MSAEYFCWLCDGQASHLVAVSQHYEDPRRIVRFCSQSCREAYLQLAAL